MKSLHLFAGIGGGILADKILGHKIAGAVEIEPYCRDVLRQRQKQGYLESFPIFEDIRTFQGNEIKGTIELVCGGFPCQDISTAGRGEGLDKGKKSRLFYELVRVCGQVKPAYIFLENSPAITSRGLDSVLKKIAELGFDAEWTVISAGGCGAPHLRKRWWCLCKNRDSKRVGRNRPEKVVSDVRKRFQKLGLDPFVESPDSKGGGHSLPRGKQSPKVATLSSTAQLGSVQFGEDTDPASERLEASLGKGIQFPSRLRQDREQDAGSSSGNGDFRDPVRLGRDENNVRSQQGDVYETGQSSFGDTGCLKGWWEVEPALGRVADGIPHRVDSIKGLGNAQVPVVAALAFYCLMERFCE